MKQETSNERDKNSSRKESGPPDGLILCLAVGEARLPTTGGPKTQPNHFVPEDHLQPDLATRRPRSYLPLNLTNEESRRRHHRL